MSSQRAEVRVIRIRAEGDSVQQGEAWKELSGLVNQSDETRINRFLPVSDFPQDLRIMYAVGADRTAIIQLINQVAGLSIIEPLFEEDEY